MLFREIAHPRARLTAAGLVSGFSRDGEKRSTRGAHIENALSRRFAGRFDAGETARERVLAKRDLRNELRVFRTLVAVEDEVGSEPRAHVDETAVFTANCLIFQRLVTGGAKNDIEVDGSFRIPLRRDHDIEFVESADRARDAFECRRFGLARRGRGRHRTLLRST